MYDMISSQKRGFPCTPQGGEPAAPNDSGTGVQEKERMNSGWLVQIGEFQPGHPAYISIVCQDSVNEPQQFPTTLSTGGTIMSADAETKRSRPCKGKRLRYRRFVERLITQISENPESCNVESAAFPPSHQEDKDKLGKLMHRMQCYRDQVKAGIEIDIAKDLVFRDCL